MVACESHKLDGAGSTPASASMIAAPVQGGGICRAHSRDYEGEWRNGRRSGLKIRRREA